MTYKCQTSLTTKHDSNIFETYKSAVANGIDDTPTNTTYFGVVRKPMFGLTNIVRENLTALSPPETLLTEFKQKVDELEDKVDTDTHAHNMAWSTVNFEKRYSDYLHDAYQNQDGEFMEAIETVKNEAENGPTAIVCFEANEKHCHRHILKSFLEEEVM